MQNKEIIIYTLNKLKKKYSLDESKKWNLKAISTAIDKINSYNGIIYDGTQLKNEIKGIGDKIAIRIDEIIKTGTLVELNDIDNTNDDSETSLNNLLLITGVGLVRAKKWISIGITNIDKLKEAIQNKVIKSTHHIDIGIKYYNDFQLKIPRIDIDYIKDEIKNVLFKINSKLIFEICGSYRRGLLESGDIDILISHPDFYEHIISQNFLQKIVKELTKADIIIDNLTSKGDTKFMGVCYIKNSIGRRIDIRVVDYYSYYTSIIYFTGNKDFNIYLRNKALENDYTLNEYSLSSLKDDTKIILHSEEDIFKILKIPYLKPTERNI
jgi:DNA polymerase/3'-5' exonuclease PolX